MNLFQIFGSTAGEEVRKALKSSGEPPVHQLREWYEQQQSEPSSSPEFWRLCALRDEYRAQYHAYWQSTRGNTASKKVVDGVILPIAPSAAVQEGFFHHFGRSLASCSSNSALILETAYTAIASFLDYTAGCVPVTFADRALDPEETRYKPVNQQDRQHWRTCKSPC